MVSSSIKEISCLLVNQSIYSNRNNKPSLAQHKVIFVVTALSFVVNMMLIYGFYKTSRPFSIVTKLFICLSVWDVLTAVGFSASALMTSFAEGGQHCLVLLILFAFGQFQFFFAVDLFLTISVLRFIALRWPLRRIRSRYVYYVVIAEIIVGNICSFSPLWVVLRQGTLRNDTFQISRYISSILIAFVVVILAINILSYRQLEKSRRRTKSTISGSEDIDLSNPSKCESFDKKREAVKTLILITLCYLVCYLPYAIYMFFIELDGGNRTMRYNLKYIGVANGGLNSLIYILRTKKIRNFYKEMFCTKTDHENF